MIVSRDHVPNLASASPIMRDEYQTLVKLVCNDDAHGLNNVLEAEHGGAEGERGGACITHVHVNLIPGANAFVDMFDRELSHQTIDQSLDTLGAAEVPYILLRSSRDVRLYNARGASSQLIRRVLFSRSGRDDWDWAAFPHLDDVTATIRLWKK